MTMKYKFWNLLKKREKKEEILFFFFWLENEFLMTFSDLLLFHVPKIPFPFFYDYKQRQMNS